MEYVQVRTQAELDAALKKPAVLPVCIGDGYFDISGSASVRASGSASVCAYGSASVRASGSASVLAYGSASVRASGSASVLAYDSASVRAYDSASVSAYDSASVRASPLVAIHNHGTGGIDGGVVIDVPPVTSLEQWFARYGVVPADGIVVLYKAVDESFVSSWGCDYSPGTVPVASDWNPVPECGEGLHFCATPVHALKFCSSDRPRFVACPVRVEDIVFHEGAVYPTKVKAKGCAGPTWEVDVHGNELARHDIEELPRG